MGKISSNYRETWVNINLNHIRYNVSAIKKWLPEDVLLLAAVKANAYGHGAVPVAYAAKEAGVDAFGVATLDEAIELREGGIDSPILILGYVPPKYASIALQYDLTVTVFQSNWVEETANFLKDSDKQLQCHIKIDSGMGRLGIRTEEEGNALIGALKKYENHFSVEGVFTHFATADEEDLSYFQLQYNRFTKMLHYLEQQLQRKIKIKHCGNSAMTLRFPHKGLNMVRVGIAMYGLSPSEKMKEKLPFPLKEAFSLHSKITHVKKVDKGDGISYGATYRTSGEEWIGTVPIGYADGWLRANSPGDVIINGKRYPIVGRICMDQLMVALPEAVPIDTKVTLIGRQGDEYISVDEVAKRLNTINYEVPCMISYRVPRITIG